MEKGQNRPPIVTVLGHVDHGKTTLLDAIRKTNVALKEAGGITQKIGASVVTIKEGKRITFIDTPGHAAFSQMRSRGAKVADIALLVVDASDGVKPQTQEALQMIKEEKIPFIVVGTKIDLPAASIETVQGQLEKEGVAFERRGGDIPLVAVSAKTGKGIENLLETITLVAEVHGLEGGKNDPLEAVIIETSKEAKGPLASVVVRKGTLKVGDFISGDNTSCKVKGLFNDKGESVKEVFPGEPASILGFEKLPSIGAQISLGTGQKIEETKKEEAKIEKIRKGQLAIILKAKSAGSLEAVKGSLPGNVVVLDSGVGEINQSDILLAKPFGARVVAFESEVNPEVTKLAETEGVKIEKFAVIYELIQRLEEILQKGQVEILGKAEIIATFPFNNKRVAGCKVLEGKFTKNDKLELLRGGKKLGSVRASSMRKQKQEISQAKVGEEFGVIFEPQLDFAIGDMLVSMGK
jgi:translation initiation factor IF-2